jgi:hypothetical protein
MATKTNDQIILKIKHGNKAKVWIQEICAIQDLGTVSITGISDRCLISSQKKQCKFNGKDFDFFSIFTLTEAYGAEMEEFVLGKSSISPLDDNEIQEVKTIIKGIMEEWWDTDEAKAMIAENNKIQKGNQNRLDLKQIAKEKENIIQNLYKGLETVADMEKRIRDLQQLNGILKGAKNV